MKKRQLGRSNLMVAPLAFGGNVFGWTVNEAVSFQLLDRFVDYGLNLIDTADIYSTWVPGHQGGESETIIGRWLKHSGKRDKVILATKVGMDMGAKGKGLSAKYIMKAVEDSLKRLQVDCIDLYQSHTDDTSTPIEETLGAYDKLIRAGKVRFIGASNFSRERLSQSLDLAHKLSLPSYVALQPNYNLYDREDFEQNMANFCLENQVGVISYFSLASGFLTGKYRSEADVKKSVRGSKSLSYLNAKGYNILNKLDQVAKEHKATPAQVALAWLIHKPPVTAPIASATSLDQLEEIMQAVKLNLNSKTMDYLNEQE